MDGAKQEVEFVSGQNILQKLVLKEKKFGNYFEVSVNSKLYSCDVYGNGNFYHSIAEFKLLEE